MVSAMSWRGALTLEEGAMIVHFFLPVLHSEHRDSSSKCGANSKALLS